MVIYKYYINGKYNASALNIPMFWIKTSGCCDKVSFVWL